MSDFDYGTEEELESGSLFKNPTVGDHTAVLRSIIHCGMYKETYKGKAKRPAPEVVAIFELKDEDDFEEDGVTPLELHKAFALKKNDKAFMMKFIKALDPKGKAKGFDDLIGTPCQVNCKGSKELNEDGAPKYINFGGMSGLAPKFAKMIEPLAVQGSGHVRFNELTEEAILELNPILEVANILMKGEQYAGSVAEQIINKIRVDNPDFAVPSKKQETDTNNTGTEKPARAEVKTDLSEDEEF